ncbi:S8 family serine peptidase [Kamptonema formosum]|uniref:S8 family serine peptidase n=1 Tax=Kamptonema formosum TaxID=331992 RepID=UPI0003812B26|nr:S8 family serine peptidase [Oscillatoria sp. PCC 10802]
MAHVPTDPLYPQQWYLNNTGTNSNGGTTGMDLNIVDDSPDNFDLWNDCTGRGITVGIIDDGVESTHEDLAANYNKAPVGLTAGDLASGQPQAADESHRTAVAGIMAGVPNKQVGISGIGYSAKITGLRDTNLTGTDASVLSTQQFFDVSNNSWGFDNPFETNFKLPAGQLAGQGIQEAVTKGRGGLGTVFTSAAGNAFETGANANCGNCENSRYTIAVAAADANGVFAPYSVQCANLLVSAFGDSDPKNNVSSTILTTDRMGDAGYNAAGKTGEADSVNYIYITLLSPDSTETILFDTLALKTLEVGDDGNGNGVEVPFADLRTNPSQFTQDATEQALGESCQKGIKFTFGSTFYWGETGEGDWTLKVEDRGSAGTCSLNSWGLRLYGAPISPDGTNIYTDEFGTVACNDTVRGTLTDAGGIDTINAAAITTGMTLDLTPGSTGNTLADGTLAIDANTTIKSVFGGDGNDTQVGNNANKTIFGGRGADSLMGGAGDDTLMGGKAANTLMGGVGADVYVLSSKSGGTFIQDEDGAADTLVFSEDSITGFSAAPAAGMTLSADGLAAGVMGIVRQGTNLVIDLDASGTIEGASDLTIANFSQKRTPLRVPARSKP